VEGAARVLDLDPLEAVAERAPLLGQLLEALDGPEYAGARIHVALHLLADHADLLVAALLVEVVHLNAPCLVREHRGDGIAAGPLGRARALRGTPPRNRPALLAGRPPGTSPQPHASRQRVGAQPVAAVEPDVRALAGRI